MLCYRYLENKLKENNFYRIKTNERCIIKGRFQIFIKYFWVLGALSKKRLEIFGLKQ